MLTYTSTNTIAGLDISTTAAAAAAAVARAGAAIATFNMPSLTPSAPPLSS
jgi:hypothetical protein